jgi:3-oxoacyl-[acyl-carrier-protein] synthase-3
MIQQKITAAITAVGGYVPETRLTNFDLEKMVDTNDEWIRSRTGVEERRILKEPGKGSSDLAVPAILQICEKRGISPDEIDCIICATVTPDMVFPATANIISDKVGAKNAWGFDLSAACSGFLYALTTGAALIESRRYKKVVVVGVDKMSAIIDYSDRQTCIIFGDGAGAVLLEPNMKDWASRTVFCAAMAADGNTCI